MTEFGTTAGSLRTGSMMTLFWMIVLAVGAATLAASYLGRLHPLGDSLAVFRPWIAGGVGLLALIWLLVGPTRELAALTLLGAAFALVQSLPLAKPQKLADFTQPQVIYQKNLLFRLATPERVLADIAAVAPDFITLQEVSRSNYSAVYEALPPEYHRHYCDYASVGGVAVASRYEVVPGSAFCIEHRGMVGFQVHAPTGPLWLVSVHLHWPFPYDQPAQVAELTDILEALEGPVLIGGDFNMVPGSSVLRRFAQASGSRVAPPIAPTFRLFRGLLAPTIDNLLLPETGGILDVRPGNGSDHSSVVGVFEGAARP